MEASAQKREALGRIQKEARESYLWTKVRAWLEHQIEHAQSQLVVSTDNVVLYRQQGRVAAFRELLRIVEQNQEVLVDGGNTRGRRDARGTEG